MFDSRKEQDKQISLHCPLIVVLFPVRVLVLIVSCLVVLEYISLLQGRIYPPQSAVWRLIQIRIPPAFFIRIWSRIQNEIS